MNFHKKLKLTATIHNEEVMLETVMQRCSEKVLIPRKQMFQA